MKPLTRKEIFENAIAQGKNAPIEPITREEMILAAHAKREASGGGGTGGGGDTGLLVVNFKANYTYSEEYGGYVAESVEASANYSDVVDSVVNHKPMYVCGATKAYDGTPQYNTTSVTIDYFPDEGRLLFQWADHMWHWYPDGRIVKDSGE